jgi:putative endonuclease
MPRPDTFYVYIMASKSGVTYVGVTGSLASRVLQHQRKLFPGFTKKYNGNKLVWFEPHTSIRTSIRREKQIKAWARVRKVHLIEDHNPTGRDFSRE